ncbi:MAG TPA: cytochrome c oxidase subunit 3 [Polyangia bacterium]|nr:cytochrome c oxidase subunit 3 [Polyangia bacterium]
MSAAASARQHRREVDATVGLVIFLGATAMLFAALLLAYAILRAEAPSWPPAGTPPFPRGAATVNTAVLLAASLALRHARSTGRRAPAFGALALGTLFLGLQALLWRHLVATHLGPSAGPLGDVFFALSAFHGLHVLGGLVALAVTRARPLRLLSLYWDFVLAVWLIIYLAVCWL